MKSMTYAHITVRFNPSKSGARMPLITSRRQPYAFRAALDARRSGLERMAGELRHD